MSEIAYNGLQKFGFVHLSAGDLLREERAKPGSEFGDLIEGHIKNGTIVPVEITCSLLERAMKVCASGNLLYHHQTHLKTFGIAFFSHAPLSCFL